MFPYLLATVVLRYILIREKTHFQYVRPISVFWLYEYVYIYNARL